MAWSELISFVRKHPLITFLGVPAAALLFSRILKTSIHRSHSGGPRFAECSSDPLESAADPASRASKGFPHPEQPVSAPLSMELKNDLIRGVFDYLKVHKPADILIRFGQSAIQGYRGYYLSRDFSSSIFFGWSTTLEEKIGITPFWIVLDEKASERFACSPSLTLRSMPHPSVDKRLVVPVPAEDVKRADFTGELLLELAVSLL